MALSFSLVAQGVKASDGSENSNAATSASFTPAANSLLIAWACYDYDTDAPMTNLACSGGSLTWSDIGLGRIEDAFDSGGFNDGLQVFIAQVGSSPSSMTVTMTPTGSTDSLCVGVIQVTGAKPVASVIGGTASATHLLDAGTMTLSATPANNSVIFAMRTGDDISAGYVMRLSTPGSGWVELVETAYAFTQISCQTRNGGTSTTVGWTDCFVGATVATEDSSVALAFEVKSAPNAPPPFSRAPRFMPRRAA